MRLMTYTAPTAAEAMQLVRDNLGDKAIIVSNQCDADGRQTRVTAALEEPPTEGAEGAEGTASGLAPPNDEDDEGNVQNAGFKAADLTGDHVLGLIRDSVRRILTRHGAPDRLAERLALAAGKIEADTPSQALTDALDGIFTFDHLDPTHSGDGGGEKPVILVGPPGGGKTVAVAKLAAECTMSGNAPSVFSADTRRAGGIEQLEAFTRLLETELVSAGTPEDLGRAVAQHRPGCFTIIDTPGINPFDADDMAYIGRLIAAAKAEPIMVLAAGGDAQETADMALTFSALGVKRLIVTRLDVSRRIGGTLAAADTGRMAFAGVGISPRVADAIIPLKASSLARMILVRRNNSRNLDGIQPVEAPPEASLRPAARKEAL